jgi:hypothetical protein
VDGDPTIADGDEAFPVAAERGHPEGAVRGLRDGSDVVARQAIRVGHGAHPLGGKTMQTALAFLDAKPHMPFAILGDNHDAARLDVAAVLEARFDQRAVRAARDQTTGDADPEHATAILEEGVDRDTRQASPLCDDVAGAPVQRHQSAIRADSDGGSDGGSGGQNTTRTPGWPPGRRRPALPTDPIAPIADVRSAGLQACRDTCVPSVASRLR